MIVVEVGRARIRIEVTTNSVAVPAKVTGSVASEIIGPNCWPSFALARRAASLDPNTAMWNEWASSPHSITIVAGASPAGCHCITGAIPAFSARSCTCWPSAAWAGRENAPVSFVTTDSV